MLVFVSWVTKIKCPRDAGALARSLTGCLDGTLVVWMAVWLDSCLDGRLGGEARVMDSLGLCWRSCTNTWYMGELIYRWVLIVHARKTKEGRVQGREGGAIREGGEVRGSIRETATIREEGGCKESSRDKGQGV